MSNRGRVVLFFAGMLPLAILFVLAVRRLPPAGEGRGLNGDLIVGASVDERHATDVVTAINFDYRGFDTLGEELILFSSVLGVVILLRKSDEGPVSDDGDEGDDGDRDDDRASGTKDDQRGRRVPPTSDAVRVVGLGLFGFTILFGLYIIGHGQLTPGGGFQGGIIVASAWVLLYLAGSARLFERLTPRAAVEAIEAVGALAYVLLGLGGLVGGGAFLANFVPLGPVATLHSGGTIALLGVATGLEVTGAFILVVAAFVEEALATRQD